MEIKYLTVQEAIQLGEQLKQSPKEILIVNYADIVGLATGKGTEINRALCQEKNIPIMELNHLGGAILVSPGDLNILEIKRGHSNFGMNALKAAQEYLKRQGLNTTIYNNDLILPCVSKQKAYKIGSYGACWLEGYTETVVHFSIFSDPVLIQQLCLKESKTTPGALGVYGINAPDLWSAIQHQLKE